jgi:membrane peptidoglycan carboxypeptidase
MILAIEVERRYTKDQILQMYLNEAPYGGSLWGVGSAAKGYFNKSPKELDLAEAAFIAGLPQSPSYYSPFIGKNNAWKGRSYAVLRRMREDGYITRKQESEAQKEVDAMKFTEPNIAINAPHFVFYTKDLLEKQYGPKISDQGLKVKTTLSLEVQQTVEKIVKTEIEKLKSIHVKNGAAVVLDSQTGEVLSMVGSYDYNNSDYGKFNAAVGSRQPGSSIKPVTYSLAFEKGYTPLKEKSS